MAKKTVAVGEDELAYVMSQANIFYYLNREELSRDSKVPRSTINKILQGRISDPSVRTIRKIYLAIKKKEEQKNSNFFEKALSESSGQAISSL